MARNKYGNLVTFVAIVDYGSGNLRSVEKAFERVCGQGNVIVSSNSEDLAKATHIVLPGVGAFGDCAVGLRDIKDMEAELNKQVIQNKKPFLGICVGMQLLAETGLEYGEHKGLGWIKGVVKKIEPEDKTLPIPHMGWNSLNIIKDSKLTKGVEGDVYFVHSYAMDCTEKNNIVATTTYGSATTAIVEKDNIYGVQFHPEKSQKTGLKILENFISI